MELYALKEDNCTYMSHFVADSQNGIILLSIANDASLMINYLDVINYSLTAKEAAKDY